jgi:hypothetical protein
MKKLNEDEKAWIKEEVEVMSELGRDIEKLSMANLQLEGFIFENKLSLPMTFHIQSMNGERIPHESYKSFMIGVGEILFLSKAEVKELRARQTKELYGESLMSGVDEVLKIIARLNDWNYTADIPIELVGCHSFLFTQKVKKLTKRYVENSYPIVCQIKNNVIV